MRNCISNVCHEMQMNCVSCQPLDAWKGYIMNNLNKFSTLGKSSLSQIEGGSVPTSVYTLGLKILWSAYKHRKTIEKSFNKGFYH